MNKRVLINIRRDIESCIKSENFYKIGCYKQKIAMYSNALRLTYMEELRDRGMSGVESYYVSVEMANKRIKEILKDEK